MGTTDKLVEDLLRKPPSSLRSELVRNAMMGRYHDFKSTLAAPKVQLVADLQRYGYDDLARRAMRGEYEAVRKSWHSLTDEWKRDLADLYEEITGEKPPLDMMGETDKS